MHKIQHYDVSSINTNTYAYFYLLDGYGESLIKKQFSVKYHAWSFFVQKKEPFVIWSATFTLEAQIFVRRWLPDVQCNTSHPLYGL